VWVKPKSEKARANLGKRIALSARVDAPDPSNKTSSITPQVAFEAMAVVGNLEIERDFRERKVVGKSGVRLQPDKAACVLLIHDDGALEERFASLDKNDPAKKKITERVYKAQARTGP
jgi:hypothetical protein